MNTYCEFFAWFKRKHSVIDIDELYTIEKPATHTAFDMSFAIKEKLAANHDPRIYDYE